MVRSSAAPRHAVLTKAAIYAAIWYAGVCVEMGVPVFLGLIIFAMFTCGTSEKWAGDASAYSVFNDGERIAGTMTAEQVDAQMRNGGSVPQRAATYESSFLRKATRGWGGGSEQRPLTSPRTGTPAASGEQLRQRREAAAAAAQARASAPQGVSDGPESR